MATPCPAANRPDLLDHREQKGGGQPEQQHSIEGLQGTHHLPVRFQKDICVTVVEIAISVGFIGYLPVGLKCSSLLFVMVAYPD